MPRFSVKDLMIATTLIAIGAGLLWFIFNSRYFINPEGVEPGFFVGSFFGLGLIGAGLGTPFHRPWVGAVLFVIFAMVVLYLYAVLTVKNTYW